MAGAPSAQTPPVETATQPQVQTEVAAEATVSDYVLFSINVQDFSHPEQSAAALDKIISLHETYNVPVDIYLTDVMAQIYAEQYPALLERLKASPVVAVSYHVRPPPRPYYNNYDWLGLSAMSADQLYETILRYETHAVDPVTGQTSDEAGGYQYVSSLIGYAPYAGSALSDDPKISAAAAQVFRELGAQMTIKHGSVNNLGDTKNGLPVRPEHYDYKLYEQVGEDAAQAFETALTQAHDAQGARAPYFVGVKMHDNNFFAAESAWLTVYMNGGKRPPWNPELKAALLSQAGQDAMWAMYEQTVIYVASQQGRIAPVNLPMVLDMIRK